MDYFTLLPSYHIIPWILKIKSLSIIIIYYLINTPHKVNYSVYFKTTSTKYMIIHILNKEISTIILHNTAKKKKDVSQRSVSKWCSVFEG